MVTAKRGAVAVALVTLVDADTLVNLWYPRFRLALNKNLVHLHPKIEDPLPVAV